MDPRPSSSACPSREELSEFTLGRLHEPRYTHIVDHVTSCPSCDARLRELDDAEDPLLAGLRTSACPPTGTKELVPPNVLRAARNGLALSQGSDADPESKDNRHGRRNPSPSEQPRRLDQFELVEFLGGGSFGHVYRARDLELSRTVAIKIMRAGRFASEEEIERFRREARSAAQLKHPSIVLLYGTGQTEGQSCYLIEEFIQGTTLEHLIRDACPDSRRSAELVRDIAKALDYAHGKGVIHRDIKPSNILIDAKNKPHITDFGLAKQDSDDATMTPDGFVLGTPHYMSPEQARGEVQTIDERSDLYSLGVVLYELLTGVRPFRGNRRMLLLQVLEEEPRPPRRLHDKVPRDLETICLKAMEKSPSRRYRSAQDLSDDLQRYLNGEPIRARPVGSLESVARWCLRNPVPTSLLLILTIGALIGLGHLSHLTEKLMKDSALQSAANHAELLEDFNAEYSAKVVDRLGDHGIIATHDYARRAGTIPLPATFLTELGDSLRCNQRGMQVRHYSEYPFRFREEEGGPQDGFSRDALEALKQNPRIPYYRFVEDFEGQSALRYATARMMQASCISCHNNHPESTKTDWVVGDVRGVLEIIRPLDEDLAAAQRELRGTHRLLAGALVALLGLSIFVMLNGRSPRDPG